MKTKEDCLLDLSKHPRSKTGDHCFYVKSTEYDSVFQKNKFISWKENMHLDGVLSLSFLIQGWIFNLTELVCVGRLWSEFSSPRLDAASDINNSN